MSFPDSELLCNFMRICDAGASRGWHERNGGSLSYLMQTEEVDKFRRYFFYRDNWQPLGCDAPHLGGAHLVVTGMNRCMRNMSYDPKRNVCVMEISRDGTMRRVIWGLIEGGKPTTGLRCHVLGHDVSREMGNENLVMYHAHPANLIALTFSLPPDEVVMTNALWHSLAECVVALPQGVGVLPYLAPGGDEIAHRTQEAMRKNDALIWAHHGVFCAGKTVDEAFGMVEAIEKGAEIYIRARSMGKEPAYPITDDEIRATANALNLDFDERFLG